VFPFVLVITLVLCVAAAVLSAAETAVLLLALGRVHRLVEAERPGAQALEELAQRPHRIRGVSALMSALTFGSAALAGGVAGGLGSSSLGPLWEFVCAVLAVAIVFALTQALPRALGVANPESVGLDAAPFARGLVVLCYPLVRALTSPFVWLVRIAGAEHTGSAWASDTDGRPVDSDEESDREEAEEALLEAVSDFADMVVREVMVPRTDMKALPDTARAQDAVALIDRTGFSRMPVYHESTDDIRGVLYAKDLLVALSAGRADGPILPLARDPYFVPESKPVAELLVEMRARTHIAIVADEYGGTAGLVTLEDLLEEIVGDISDEYDRVETLIAEIGEGRYCVDARLPVDDLNEQFGTDIETEADSVGGLFTELAGRIPAAGESLELEGLRLTVTELQGTRIRQLTVEPAADSDQEGAHDA
jgi:CBS domain containing-hemolysin-like protein